MKRSHDDVSKEESSAPSSSSASGAATGAGSGTTASASTGTASTASSPPGHVAKRSNYLAWDDYFLSVAFLSAQRSKDPSTQVGACIVDSDNRIVGIGYNGFPRGCDDDALPWARTGKSELDTKYPYVCHAEMNAILNKNTASLKGARMYVALFPCNECAKLIIQSGITEVIYYSDKHHAANPFVASRRLLDMAGIVYRQHTPRQAVITIDFASIN